MLIQGFGHEKGRELVVPALDLCIRHNRAVTPTFASEWRGKNLGLTALGYYYPTSSEVSYSSSSAPEALSTAI